MVLCLGLTLLAGPAAAEAAQRYAAPDANGVTCKQSEPCSLEDAINGASANDEVIVEAGDYEITGAPINVVFAGLQIHGDFAGPMPRISAQLGGLPAINLVGGGSSISYVDVRNRGDGGGRHSLLRRYRFERVRASVAGEGTAGANMYPGCAVRDSLFLAQGTNSLGLESVGDGRIDPLRRAQRDRDSDRGNSVGIQSRYNDSSAGSHTLTLTNSIAHGASDLRTEDGDGRDESSPPTRTSTSSKLRAPARSRAAGNQSAQPSSLPRRRLPRGPGVADDRCRGR